MSNQDPRRQTRELREALQRYEREQLIDMLTHVFSHYVLEGAPPEASGTAGALGLSAGEFAGLSFAQVVERLQLRLSLPELALLEVQRGQVSVRVEGRLVPLRADAVPAPAEPPRAPAPAAERPPEVREAALPAGLIPRATGVTVSGRSVTVTGGTRQPAAPTSATPGTQREELPARPAAPAAPGARAAPAAPAAAPAPQSSPQDVAGSRFSLLEID